MAQFESYKQGQLPDIRAKEQAYFEQTASLLTRLAEGMPIAASSKTAFLKSMGLEITDWAIVHRQDVDLQLPLSQDQRSRLRTDNGGPLAFGEKASKHERSLYLAIASGKDAPAGVSFYQVPATHLRASVGAAHFNQIAASLNQNYLSQITNRLDGNQPLLVQLVQRGLVVERPVDRSIWIGHHLSNREQFVPLPSEVANRLQREFFPTLDKQRVNLQSGIGRNLVSLQQALDVQDAKKIAWLVGNYTRQLTRTYPGAPGTMPVPTATSMLSQLTQLYAKQVETSTMETKAHQPEKPAIATLGKTAQISQTVQTSQPSIFAQQLLNLLQQASITPLERGQLAAQLGLRWQARADGTIRVVEGNKGFTPGATFQLSPQQQALFTIPGPASKASLLTSEIDRVLLHSHLAGKPLTASGILPWQLARLNLPVLEKILPKVDHAPLHQWYNGQRGHKSSSIRRLSRAIRRRPVAT